MISFWLNIVQIQQFTCTSALAQYNENNEHDVDTVLQDCGELAAKFTTRSTSGVTAAINTSTLPTTQFKLMTFMMLLHCFILSISLIYSDKVM